jgi:hypothetical protein
VVNLLYLLIKIRGKFKMDVEKSILVKKFPEPLYRRFKARCVMEKVTIKEALIEAMDMWIRENGNKTRKT